jgi:hypothetical protein
MSHHFLCHKNVYHIMIEKLLLSYLNLYNIQKIMEQFPPCLLEISEQSSTNVLLLTRNWMHHGTQGTFVYSRGARSPGETTSLAVTLGAIHAQLASSCHPGPEVLKYILVN